MQHIGELQVKEVMDKVTAVHPSASIKEIVTAFEKCKLGTIAVINDKGKFLGDIHERDLIKLVVDPSKISIDLIAGVFGRIVDMDYFARNAKDLMRRHEIKVKPTDKVKDAVLLMFRHELTAIPVVEDKKVVGIITEMTILDKIYKHHRRRKK
jgi:predicted transcriptional regulator